MGPKPWVLCTTSSACALLPASGMRTRRMGQIKSSFKQIKQSKWNASFMNSHSLQAQNSKKKEVYLFIFPYNSASNLPMFPALAVLMWVVVWTDVTSFHCSRRCQLSVNHSKQGWQQWTNRNNKLIETVPLLIHGRIFQRHVSCCHPSPWRSPWCGPLH